MKKTILVAAIGTAFVATPVFAQDAPVRSGPRIEARVGWDRVNINVDGEGVGKSGITYGGEVGYDIVTGGGAVIGAYAGIDGSSTKECLVEGTERGCVKAGRNITVGARIGALVGSRALLYAKGGYSNGRISVDYTDTAFPADNFSEGENGDGFHLGAGVEVGMSRSVYGKLEYNYTKYSTNTDDADFDVDLDRHRVLAGVGIRF